MSQHRLAPDLFTESSKHGQFDSEVEIIPVEY